MEELKKLMENYSGATYDFCYDVLQKYGDKEEVFEYVCSNFLGKPQNGTIQTGTYFTELEIDEYKAIYGDLVDGFLHSTIKKCNVGLIDSRNFYKSLWEVYCSNFKTSKEKAFAFYYTIIDPMIPYQFLGKPVSMSNDKFKELTEKNREIINKIKYIEKSQYSQRTERASLLLNCLETADSFEDKTVILAHGISLLGKQPLPRSAELDHIIEQINKKIVELQESED